MEEHVLVTAYKAITQTDAAGWGVVPAVAFVLVALRGLLFSGGRR